VERTYTTLELKYAALMALSILETLVVATPLPTLLIPYAAQMALPVLAIFVVATPLTTRPMISVATELRLPYRWVLLNVAGVLHTTLQLKYAPRMALSTLATLVVATRLTPLLI
jgi:hypothetical protein